MPSLLSNSQKLQIRKALRDVTDTFMVTPVTYHIAGEQLDRWNEDQEEQIYYDVNLKALVESITEDNEIKRSVQGDRDLAELKITMNLEDMQDLGVITSDFKHIFNPTQDYFRHKGLLYKVIDIYYDGPLDEKDVLVVIEGELSKDAIVPMNNVLVGNDIPVDEIISGNLTGEIEELKQKVEELENEEHLDFETLPELPCDDV